MSEPCIREHYNTQQMSIIAEIWHFHLFYETDEVNVKSKFSISI